MKAIIIYLFFIFSGLATIPVEEAKKTGYLIGDQVENFSLKNIDGKIISLNDYSKNKGVILIFTCNHCPFSIAYEDRIIDLHHKFSSMGFPVIAVNPNDANAYPDDSFENMKKRAKEKNFPFAYLHDESQELAKNYGATRTPHVFILKKADKNFQVAYIGAIDDNTDNPAAVSKTYVATALEEILAGKVPTISSTKAIGCSIKWKK